MAFVPLSSLGKALSSVVDGKTSEGYRKKYGELESTLEQRRAGVHAGWGEKYIDRVHAKGKMTARERVEALKDPDGRVFEVGTFVNDGREFQGGLKSPGAGVVTAFVEIQGRFCMVIANDNTVASGSWWPQTPEKIERAQEMALKLRLPVVYLVDCSGLFLPEQSKTFSGARGAGYIFKMNSLLSDGGVPQVAGVFGDCIAGGGYMPLISDRVYMTEQAYMVIAGAALIKGAKSQKLTSLDIGGPEVHVSQSGCADVRVPDDATLLRCVREEIGRMPTTAVDYYRGGTAPMGPAFDAGELTGLVPPDHREGYDVCQMVARLCDQSLFWEFSAGSGEEILCGVGRVSGLYMGFVTNRQGLVDNVDAPGTKRPASTLYREGIAKISAFSRACNADGIPLVWLHDISGFDIGTEAERQGLLGYGSSLIYTNSTNTVPMFSVLLRKAAGAGYYALAGAPFDPVVQLSTTVGRLSVMEGRTLAIATYNTKLDDDFEIATDDPEERAKIEAGMAEVEARIEGDMDPYKAASQMDTDEVIKLDELRPWLEVLAEASYQAAGVRRVKNPRIWSLHDLDQLAGRGVVRTAKGDGAESTTSATGAAAGSKASADGKPCFVSPTAGRFYRRTKPEDPPLAEVGQMVKPGDVVGLIEVMKTFTRLPFEGAAPVKVTKFLAEDGADVNAGDVLFTYEPA